MYSHFTLSCVRRQHAVTMAKFAKDILIETAIVTLKLEKRLGPGTSTLRVRVGVSTRINILYYPAKCTC